MPGVIKRRTARRSAIAVTVLPLVGAGLLIGLGGGPAAADLGSDPSPTQSTGAGGNGSTYTVRVTYTHRGEGDSPQPVQYAGAFTPPVCWYTAMTPDQMRTEIKRRFYAAGHDGSGTTYEFYNNENNRMEDDGHYNQGKDGSWWVLTWDQTQLDAGNYNCPYDQGYFWRKPADPPVGRITPDLLAKAAYGQMKLPGKGVRLSPAPDNQKVNLPTYVSFAAAAAQVSVTAQVTEPDGQVVAATVVARPSSLDVKAGTPYASPGSCTYPLGGSPLDSSGAACNITYNKATAGQGYPFTADMTWNVWWTATADAQPTGTAITPQGFSEYREPVTVQEIQTVNR